MGFSIFCAIVVLVGLTLAGACGTWKLAFDNGTIDLLSTLISSPRPYLPQSRIPMQPFWTTIRDIDKPLQGFLAFFWPVLRGDTPQLSLLAFHLLGQATAVWMLLLVESRRVSHIWRLVSFITVPGILINGVAYAIILPLYLLTHLITSPTLSLSSTARKTGLLVHPADLKVLPWSLALGLGIPLLFLTFTDPTPRHPSWRSKQFWILALQLHPLWTALAHYPLARVARARETGYVSAGDRNRSVARALRRVYSVATYVATLSHAGLFSLMIASRIAPAMFSPESAVYLSPVGIFVPPAFWQPHLRRVDTIPEGVLAFLQWDSLVSGVAALVWAVAVNRDALHSHPRGSTLQGLFWRTLALTLVGGPAAAAISAVRERDEILLESPEVGAQKRVS